MYWLLLFTVQTGVMLW